MKYLFIILLILSFFFFGFLNSTKAQSNIANTNGIFKGVIEIFKWVIDIFEKILKMVLSFWENIHYKIEKWWKEKTLPKIEMWWELKKIELKQEFEKQKEQLKEEIKETFSNFWQWLKGLI